MLVNLIPDVEQAAPAFGGIEGGKGAGRRPATLAESGVLPERVGQIRPKRWMISAILHDLVLRGKAHFLAKVLQILNRSGKPIAIKGVRAEFVEKELEFLQQFHR